MKTLKALLLSQSQIIEPFYSISVETIKKINEIIGEDTLDSEKSLKEWLDNILDEKPAFQVYAQLVEKFKIFRTSSMTKLLFAHFFSKGSSSLEFDTLLPFLQVISKHQRKISQINTRTTLTKPELFGNEESLANILIQMLELVEALNDNNQLYQPREISCTLLPFCGSADYLLIFILKEALHFADNYPQLLQWLQLIQNIELQALNPQEQHYNRLEFLSIHLIEETRHIIDRYPQLIDNIYDDLRFLIKYKGVFISGQYLKFLRLALKKQEISKYRIISRHLAQHASKNILRQWFRVVKKLLHSNIPLAHLEKRVQRLFYEDKKKGLNLFRPVLELKRRKITANVLENWWDEAEYLYQNVHPFAASNWLKYVVRMHEKFGDDFLRNWYRWGNKLAKDFESGVSALFFYYSKHVLALNNPPQETCFEHLVEFCHLSSLNVDWLKSDLWLQHPKRNHLNFSQRWIKLCKQLHHDYPHKPYAASYQLWGLSAKELQRDLILWEKFRDEGYHSFINCTYHKIFPIQLHEPLVQNKTLIKHAFWFKFLTILRPDVKISNLNQMLERHPLLEKMNSTEMMKEYDRLAHEPLRQRISSLDALDDARYRYLTINEIIYLLDNMPPEQFEFDWMHNIFSSALRHKKRHYPNINTLLEEILAFDDDNQNFDEIIIILNKNDTLLEIMPGNLHTSSCTDGPSGKLAFASIIHATHEEAFKLLVCKPHPIRGVDEAQPFASLPGFRIQVGTQSCLFIDSIEIGSTIYRIKNGFEILAKNIVDFLLKVADDHNMSLIFSTHFYNLTGKKLLSHIQTHYFCEDLEIDFVIYASDLKKRHINQFYSEAYKYSPTNIPKIAFLNSAQRCQLSQVPVLRIRA
jgi:hypothetical protein